MVQHIGHSGLFGVRAARGLLPPNSVSSRPTWAPHVSNNKR